jgi:hypothetical protein
MDSKKVPDISNYEETNDLWLILAAILLIDVIVIFITRFTGLLGTMLNVWYDKFGLNAVLSDVLIIFLAFLVSRWIYTKYIKPRYGWDAWIFTGLFVLIGIIHDTLFYFGVIKPITRGSNEMMDVFKDYANVGGISPIIGDAIMVAGSSAVAIAYKASSPATVATITALVAYCVPYLLYTKPIEPKIIIGGSVTTSI